MNVNVQKNVAVGGLTQEEVASALPANLKKSATPELVQQLNQMSNDPIAIERIRENFITYTHVLKDGRFKTTDYLHAVTYVTHKLMDRSNLEAWKLTFPRRYAELVAQGKPPKDLSAYAAGYHKTKIVTSLLEQAHIPLWLINQDAIQKAINTLLDVAATSKNDLARVGAATTLLSQLKRPETIKAEVTVEHKNVVDDLEVMIHKLAAQQREAIQSGATTARDLAAMPLLAPPVDADYDEVDEDDDDA